MARRCRPASPRPPSWLMRRERPLCSSRRTKAFDGRPRAATRALSACVASQSKANGGVPPPARAVEPALPPRHEAAEVAAERAAAVGLEVDLADEGRRDEDRRDDRNHEARDKEALAEEIDRDERRAHVGEDLERMDLVVGRTLGERHGASATRRPEKYESTHSMRSVARFRTPRSWRR